jgi:hypothetical protein
LAYNDNLDLIAIPRGCNKGISLSAASDYISPTFFDLNPDGTTTSGYADVYNNFLKSRYDISGGSLRVVYSTQAFSSSNPGLSDISKIADSSDLYIKAAFSGDGSITPTLKSLMVEYEGGDGATLIKKETYSDSSFSRKEGTFENGQRVYVKLTIYRPGTVSEAASVYDEITNVKSGSVNQESPLGDGRLVNASPSVDIFGATKLEFKFTSGMKQGENIIKYSYEAAD